VACVHDRDEKARPAFDPHRLKWFSSQMKGRTMATTNNKPALTLTDGSLKAAIWRNEKEDGTFYSVTFSRSYKTANGNYADANSYSGSELLRLSKLADRAYAEVGALREQAAA
jgi:hypothetical protein